MFNLGEYASCATASSTPTSLVAPLYSVLNMNLILGVTEPLKYRRALSSANLSVASSSSGSLCVKLVRTPAPTLTVGATCARSGGAARTLQDATSTGAPHRTREAASPPQTRRLNTGSPFKAPRTRA